MKIFLWASKRGQGCVKFRLVPDPIPAWGLNLIPSPFLSLLGMGIFPYRGAGPQRR